MQLPRDLNEEGQASAMVYLNPPIGEICHCRYLSIFRKECRVAYLQRPEVIAREAARKPRRQHTDRLYAKGTCEKEKNLSHCWSAHVCQCGEFDEQALPAV